MKIRFNAKSNTIAVYCVIVFTVCLLLAAVVFKYSSIFSYARRLIDILAPVIWGLVIAYILNPIVKVTERNLKKFVFRKKDRPKLSRAIGIAFATVLMLGVIAAVVGSIVPEIIETLKNIFGNMSSYLNNLQKFLNEKISRFADTHPEINEFLNSEFNNIQDFLISIVERYQPKLDNLFSENGLLANLTDSAWTFLNGLKNFGLGIIVSIYLLYSKDTMLAQSKKMVYALFSEKNRKHILSVASRANSTFSSFLSGKALDSLIIGIICFFGMMIFNMRTYAVVISVIIGITNMIPFFGPIIGAVPTGLLILLTDPNKTVVFLLFIFILQQFDGNILGPKILGNSLGLSSFWIMFAIFVGGGLFGFVGMIGFVPLFAVLYSIVSEFVASKLEKKKLPKETRYYLHGNEESAAVATGVTSEKAVAEKKEDAQKKDGKS
ncbi:MAG: AI-2E family transporter [Clostridium sp.]|nr:AI-2E family transporter [Clostridium sp.]MCM1548280.1 AI-2E family transporter [Ruminococcus sp.]